MWWPCGRLEEKKNKRKENERVGVEHGNDCGSITGPVYSYLHVLLVSRFSGGLPLVR